jgi:carbamoyltransferase
VPSGHDPATAIFVDGELVAAVEEERLIRDKHAKGRTGIEATKFCLKQAGLKPSDIDIVAYPFAPMPFFYAGRWAFAKRYWYAPDRAFTAIFNGNRRFKRNKKHALAMLKDLGFDMTKTKFQPVEHHMAHASSAYHLSGFKEKTAILGIDGKGEYGTTFFGYAENGKIHKIKEFYDPDSLGGVYGALTEFLGFDMLDGEFKVMGMAPYGDPKKYDFSRLIEYGNGDFKVNTKLVNVIGNRRYKENGKGYYFSPKLIEWLGAKRQGDEIDDPYIDYAASIQQLLEDVALHLIDFYLGDILKETGKLAFAGGVALNVKLNQRIMALPYVKELFVQPAASDAGTAIGAASYAAHEAGENHSSHRSTPTSDLPTRPKSVSRPAKNIRSNRPGKFSTIRPQPAHKSWQPATRSHGCKGVWNSAHAHSATAVSSATRATQASPTASTSRSNTASAGAPSAPACWIRSPLTCFSPITRHRT